MYRSGLCTILVASLITWSKSSFGLEELLSLCFLSPESDELLLPMSLVVLLVWRVSSTASGAVFICNSSDSGS